ncbi:hypothetical protein Tco_0727563 [Tanacetum coccineum]|uniref:Uncharacterized protein n=1 Tax=Tanacetum coccineum TaxID=301880 RepID=A0ABQ4YL92_9ASTR
MLTLLNYAINNGWIEWDVPLGDWKDIQKESQKRPPNMHWKERQSQFEAKHVKSKSKSSTLKKIQLEGLKLPNPKLYCKN